MIPPNVPVLIGLMAETHVHVGIGQSVEAIDLPVAREKATHWPFVPGSGVKGAFRVWGSEQAGLSDVDDLFGKEGVDSGDDGNAGALMFSDARLLLLPVRALNKAWRWATSPGLLRRYLRDRARAGNSANIQLPDVSETGYLGNDVQDTSLGLEEREFKCAGALDADWVDELARVTGESQDFIRPRVVVLNDDAFAWFARYGLPIMARNKLDENKRVVGGALWYEESLPSDSFLYILIGERRNGKLAGITPAVGLAPYVQMGGNETIGQGWFRMIAENGVDDGLKE